MIYRVSAHFKELFKMKILVIVDMQNDFINGALGTPEAQAAVGDVAKKISDFDGDLICITKDTHRSADYLKTQEGQLLPVEHCIEGTHGWRLDDNGKFKFPSPIPLKKALVDMLEDKVDERYYLPDDKVAAMITPPVQTNQ